MLTLRFHSCLRVGDLDADIGMGKVYCTGVVIHFLFSDEEVLLNRLELL